MASLDNIFSDFGLGEDKIETTPEIIVQTITKGNELINIDYLPKVKKVRKLKPYLASFQHMNLFEYGWRFQFGSSKEWAGLCSAQPNVSYKSKNRNIYVSIEFCKHDANWEKNMKDVILHEIAHAIIFELFYFQGKSYELARLDDLHKISNGHGIIWKEVCKAISNKECPVFYLNANLKESFKNYKYSCPRCYHVGYGDSPFFTSECSNCGASIIVEKNLS